jgi:hypothetical protein
MIPLLNLGKNRSFMMGKIFFACASGSGVFNKKNIYGSRNSSGKKLKNISKRRKKHFC